jgi:hypothetical protein
VTTIGSQCGLHGGSLSMNCPNSNDLVPKVGQIFAPLSSCLNLDDHSRQTLP